MAGNLRRGCPDLLEVGAGKEQASSRHRVELAIRKTNGPLHDDKKPSPTATAPLLAAPLRNRSKAGSGVTTDPDASASAETSGKRLAVVVVDDSSNRLTETRHVGGEARTH